MQMLKKSLLSCLCIVSFFSFNEINAGLREDLSRKKYAFSEVTFDEHAAFLHVLGKAETNKVAEEAFLLMWEEAKLGNEKFQKKLFTLFSTPAFYEKAKTRVSCLNNTNVYSLDKLIEIGFSQEKTWSFYQKAIREKDQKKKFIFLNLYLNNIYIDANKNNPEFIHARDEHNKMVMSKSVGCLELNIAKGKKGKKNEKDFIDNNIFLKNASTLIACYRHFEDNPSKFSLKCLEEAAKLGSVEAHIRLSERYKSLGKKDLYFYHLRKAAEKGDPTVLSCLAYNLQDSQSISDKEEAVKLYSKLAEEGDFNIMNNLQNLLRTLPKTNDIDILHFNLLKEMIKLGDVDSNLDLAEMYLDGIAGNNPEPKEAYKCLLDAANQNSRDAMYFLGLLLKIGFEEQEPDTISGNIWITKAADLGCTFAMNHLGGLTAFDGDGAITEKESYEWFLKASQLGDKQSMSNLAFILWFGCDGVEANEEEALKWSLKAADEDELTSMICASFFMLKMATKESNQFKAQKYLHKSGHYLKNLLDAGYFNNLLKEDPRSDEPTKLTIKSDDIKSNNSVFLSHGHIKDIYTKTNILKTILHCPLTYNIRDKAELLYSLGFLYLHGFVDGRKNKNEAFRLLLIAAKHRHMASMYLVAQMYYSGFKDQKPDHKNAGKWWLGAAESGCSEAMVNYAKLLITDPAFEKNTENLSNAFFWLKKAQSLGNVSADKYLKLYKFSTEQNEEVDLQDSDLLFFEEKNEQPDLNVFDLNRFDFIGNIEKVETNNVLDTAEEQINVVFNEDDTIISTENVEEIKENTQKSLNIIDESHQYIKNPKYIREQLRKIGELNKTKENKKVNKDIRISNENQLTIDILLDKSTKQKNINYTQLVHLFHDPFFDNQVEVKKSKSGCVIKAKNFETLDYVVASTHKKHGQSYDGLNREFAKQLINILEIFALNSR
jgi:TPR repeat protein